eukprot:tig00000189_g14325.t1
MASSDQGMRRDGAHDGHCLQTSERTLTETGSTGARGHDDPNFSFPPSAGSGGGTAHTSDTHEAQVNVTLTGGVLATRTAHPKRSTVATGYDLAAAPARLQPASSSAAARPAQRREWASTLIANDCVGQIAPSFSSPSRSPRKRTRGDEPREQPDVEQPPRRGRRHEEDFGRDQGASSPEGSVISSSGYGSSHETPNSASGSPHITAHLGRQSSPSAAPCNASSVPLFPFGRSPSPPRSAPPPCPGGAGAVTAAREPLRPAAASPAHAPQPPASHDVDASASISQRTAGHRVANRPKKGPLWSMVSKTDKGDGNTYSNEDALLKAIVLNFICHCCQIFNKNNRPQRAAAEAASELPLEARGRCFSLHRNSLPKPHRRCFKSCKEMHKVWSSFNIRGDPTVRPNRQARQAARTIVAWFAPLLRMAASADERGIDVESMTLSGQGGQRWNGDEWAGETFEKFGKQVFIRCVGTALAGQEVPDGLTDVIKAWEREVDSRIQAAALPPSPPAPKPPLPPAHPPYPWPSHLYLLDLHPLGFFGGWPDGALVPLPPLQAPPVPLPAQQQPATDLWPLYHVAGPQALPAPFPAQQQPATDLWPLYHVAGPQALPAPFPAQQQPATDLWPLYHVAGPQALPAPFPAQQQPATDLWPLAHVAGHQAPPASLPAQQQPATDLWSLAHVDGPQAPLLAAEATAEGWAAGAEEATAWTLQLELQPVPLLVASGGCCGAGLSDPDVDRWSSFLLGVGPLPPLVVVGEAPAAAGLPLGSAAGAAPAWRVNSPEPLAGAGAPLGPQAPPQLA